MPLTFVDDDIAPDRWGCSVWKQDDPIDGAVPHAWGFYRALQTGQGKAFSKERSGYLHAENLAEARQLGALMRATEKLYHNAFARRADEGLKAFVDVMGIAVFSDDTDDDVRAKCYARQLATRNDPAHMDAAVAALLGDAFVEIVRFTGDSLDDPALRTYWPGINPGPTTFDLGDNGGDPRDKHGAGAWYSDHARILVIVDEDCGIPDKKLLRLLNVDLSDLLSRRLPAFTQWNWAFSKTLPLGTSGIGTAAIGP